MASIVGSLKLNTKSAEVSKYVGFAVPTVAILISLGVAFFIVWPKYQEVLKIKDDSKQLQELSVKLEAKAAKLSTLDASKLTQQIAEAEQLLPSDKAIFEMLRQIENTAGNSGVLISNLSAQPGAVGKQNSKDNGTAAPPAPPSKDNTDPPDVSKISLKLSLTSDYRALLAFLTALSALPRVNAVRDLSVASNGGATGQITSSFSIEAYWQAMPTELPSIESPIADITSSQEVVLAKIGNNATSGTAVPQVPLGRTDLFAPF